MSKKTKNNITMFFLCIILIAYGFICGRITANVDNEKENKSLKGA